MLLALSALNFQSCSFCFSSPENDKYSIISKFTKKHDTNHSCQHFLGAYYVPHTIINALDLFNPFNKPSDLAPASIFHFNTYILLLIHDSLQAHWASSVLGISDFLLTQGLCTYSPLCLKYLP